MPLAKSVLVPLGLEAAASARDEGIQKEFFGSVTTIFLFSDEGLNGIMKIIKSLEESGLLIKDVREMVENEVKEQKRRIFRYFGCYIWC